MLAQCHRQTLSSICNQSFRALSPPAIAITLLNSNRLRIGIRTQTTDISSKFKALAASSSGGDGNSEEEFRTLDIIKSKARKFGARRVREKPHVLPPRYKSMPVDQDWPSVWPTTRSFHPASVPLPLHMGYVKQAHIASPGKFANAELMKIINFLHLTPPAIKRQCEAIKKFCTPWPKEIQQGQIVDDYFPVEILTTDYCHSAPMIQDHRARIVTLKVRLSYLNLDEHATDKFRRLVGHRYDAKTDYVTLTCDYCPLRKQNLDHGMYLLNALYHEAQKMDTWEADKSEDDMEKYVWEGSVSQSNLTNILSRIVTSPIPKPTYLEPLEKKIVSEENITAVEPVKKYRESTVSIHNKGETIESMEEYGQTVRKLFNLNKV